MLLCQLQQIEHPNDTGLSGVDGVILIVGGRCRTSKVVYLVDPLQTSIWLHDVVVDEQELRMIDERLNVADVTCLQVIDTYHLSALMKQTTAEVGADETGSSCHQ